MLYDVRVHRAGIDRISTRALFCFVAMVVLVRIATSILTGVFVVVSMLMIVVHKALY